MHLAVGSTNPVKVEAVKRGLSRFDLTTTAIEVDSGVSEQPIGYDETRRGALTRAHRAYAATDVDYGVGLEGGVTQFTGDNGYSLIMWAAVSDGDRTHFGGGPTLELPVEVSQRLEAGDELGPIMNDLLGTDDIAETEGAAGALTAGLTDRTDALATAVACAMGPFITSYYSNS